jgi:hypothetical protein
MTHCDIEMVFDVMKIPIHRIWNLLKGVNSLLFETVCEVLVDGKRVAPFDTTNQIGQRTDSFFSFRFGGASIEYSHLRNYSISVLQLRSIVNSQSDAWNWCGPLARSDAFQQARVYDPEYERWQNAEDPLQYISENRSYRGLPVRSNGLPPPLEQSVIDISANPGRRVLRDGYIEAIGSIMWFAPSFWARSGSIRPHLSSAPWLECREVQDGIVQVVAAPACFSSAEGESGRIQRSLRSLLFPVFG